MDSNIGNYAVLMRWRIIMIDTEVKSEFREAEKRIVNLRGSL